MAFFQPRFRKGKGRNKESDLNFIKDALSKVKSKTITFFPTAEEMDLFSFSNSSKAMFQPQWIN